jgi:hypothetical protein
MTAICASIFGKIKSQDRRCGDQNFRRQWIRGDHVISDHVSRLSLGLDESSSPMTFARRSIYWAARRLLGQAGVSRQSRPTPENRSNLAGNRKALNLGQFWGLGRCHGAHPSHYGNGLPV